MSAASHAVEQRELAAMNNRRNPLVKDPFRPF
jgi:hypothetical protein